MMLRVKIGTLPAGHYQQVQRAPSGAWYSVIRGLPKVGDTFAVREGFDIAVLQCTEVKDVNGEPLYFATRV